MTNTVLPVALCVSFAIACSSSEDRGSPSVKQTAAPGASSSAPVASVAASASALSAPAASGSSAEGAPAPHTSAVAPPSQTPNVALPNEAEGPAVVAFRPNGRAFAAGAGKKVSLFPVDGGEPRALPDHTRAVLALGFSLKGDRLATIEEGGKTRIWDPSAAKLIAELPDGSLGDAHAVVFSPDGKLLAAAGPAATIWSVDKKKKICSTEESWTYSLAFTPDQGSLVTTGNGQFRRWNTSTCTKEAEGGAQTGGTFGSWVSPDAKYMVASAPYGHGLALFDGRSFKGIDELAKSFGCKDHVGPVRFSRDGEILLASGSYQWFRSFRMDSKKTIAAYDVPRGDEVNAIVMFDDGERLLVIRGEKGELVSAVSKSVAYTMDTKGAQTFDLSWDRKRLLGATKEAAHVWDTATGKLVKSYPLPR